jgi:hypothetical protein
VTNRLSVEWPDPRPFRNRDGAPIRILALSDVLEPTLMDARNREALKPVDLILGCGDLDFDDLGFVADGFNAPLVYVQGNHDAEENWADCGECCPIPIRTPFVVRRNGLTIGGLGWPGVHGQPSRRSEFGAWRQALSMAIRRIGRSGPLIVISHVPPSGGGDVPTDAYHRGFRGFAWLLRRLQPCLWLHGHTPLAATREWHVTVAGTQLVNVTGAILIELLPPGQHAPEPAQPIVEPETRPVPEPASKPGPQPEPGAVPAGSPRR